MALTEKQKRFCNEYLIDLNATQAAIRAGYSEKTAQEQSARLLSKVIVQDYLAERMKVREKRTQINADYVLNRLAEIDQMDVADILDGSGNLKPVRDWPKIWRQYISGMDVSELFQGGGEERQLVGLLKKVKWPDKLRNLELLGKHVGVQAFKDKVVHEGEVTVKGEVPGYIMEMIVGKQ